MMGLFSLRGIGFLSICGRELLVFFCVVAVYDASLSENPPHLRTVAGRSEKW